MPGWLTFCLTALLVIAWTELAFATVAVVYLMLKPRR